MSNNIQINQYNGTEYNQLNPNISNLANNSNQLGGIDSSQYATKEYADGINPDFLRYKKIATFGNFNGVFNQTVNLGENKFDIRNLRSVLIKNININVITSSNCYTYFKFQIGDVTSYSFSSLSTTKSSQLITNSYVKFDSIFIGDNGIPKFNNSSIPNFDESNNNFIIDNIIFLFGGLSSYRTGLFDVYIKLF